MSPQKKRKKQFDPDIKKGLITGITALVVTSGEKVISWVLNFFTPKAAPNPVIPFEPTTKALKAVPPITPWYRYAVLTVTAVLIIISIVSFYKYFKSRK